jgi:hypothetical protein
LNGIGIQNRGIPRSIGLLFVGFSRQQLNAVQRFGIAELEAFEVNKTRLPDNGSAPQASVAEAPVGLQSIGWIHA